MYFLSSLALRIARTPEIAFHPARYRRMSTLESSVRESEKIPRSTKKTPIRSDAAPPTINLDNQDERVANLDYVPHKARRKKIHAALSNSFGFGGHNASLLFKEVE